MVPMGSTMEHKWSITTHCGRGMTVWIEAKTFCISKVLVTYLKWIRDKTDGDHEDDGIDSVGDVSVETHQGNPRSNLPLKQTKKILQLRMPVGIPTMFLTQILVGCCTITIIVVLKWFWMSLTTIVLPPWMKRVATTSFGEMLSSLQDTAQMCFLNDMKTV